MSTSTPNPRNVTIAPETAKKTPTGAAGASGEPQGKTTIDEGVVAKVAGIATREVEGVYALGGGAARALGAIRDVVGNTDLTQGVSVEVGEKQVAVDLTIVVEYPEPIQQVADQVRERVYQAIDKLIGLEVVEVNITVTDIHIPSHDEEEKDSKKAERRSADNEQQSTSSDSARVQ